MEFPLKFNREGKSHSIFGSHCPVGLGYRINKKRNRRKQAECKRSCVSVIPACLVCLQSFPLYPELLKKMRQNKHFLLSLNWLVKSFVTALIKSIYCSMLSPCRSSTYFIFVISSLIKRLIELSNVSLCNILCSNNKKVAEVQTCVATKSHMEAQGLSHNPWPCWSLKVMVVLLPEPCWSERSKLPPKAMV